MRRRGKRAWDYLLNRLSERGSMLHLVNLGAAATGVTLDPDRQEAIISTSLIAAAIIGVLTKENRP